MKFKNKELKSGIVDSIAHFKNCNKKHLSIYCDELELDYYSDGIDEMIDYLHNIKCLGENYTDQECEILDFYIEDEEYIITGEEYIGIYLDASESFIEITLYEFIKLIQDAIQVSIDDDWICISNNLAILRVITQDFLFEDLHEFPDFKKIINYQNKSITLNTSFYNNLYYMKIFFDKNFDEYNPVILGDDLFVEINFENDCDISKEEIIEIFNAYIFEIFVTYGYKLTTNPRTLLINEADEINAIDENKLILSPLLFSKGMKDILMLFNGAEGYNEDRAIVEYVKVIEYISVTVVRKNVTIEVQEKLTEINLTNPSGDYIKELGEIFIRHNKKIKSDSEMIKATIKECCDVENIEKYSPKFIRSLYNLKNDIAVNYSNRQNLINQANNDLAQSISDTRNNISHAKANYQDKGYECPDNQKEEFIILLRNVCVQVIRYFYNMDESIRIIREIAE